MIGIILSEKRLKRVNINNVEDDYFLFYMKLARKYEVNICFYSMPRLDDKQLVVRAMIYLYAQDKLYEDTVTIPRINLYRCLSSLSSKKSIHKYKFLTSKHGIIIFNMCTKADRDKYADYTLLRSFVAIRPHLPDSQPLTYSSFVSMLKKYRYVFVKRRRSGKGNDIYIFRINNDSVNLKYTYKGYMVSLRYDVKEFPNAFHELFKNPHKYYVQQGIHLKKYKGHKYDVRVSPQKYINDGWKVTGMMIRLAKGKYEVTNLDQGATSIYGIKKVMKKETKNKIKQLSVLICEALERKFPHFIDYGIDFAVDEKENVWFLEVNFRPYRKKVAVKRNRIPFKYVCDVYKQLK